MRRSPTQSPMTIAEAFKPTTTAHDAVALMVRVLDRQDEHPQIRQLRDWGIARSGLAPGKVAVDVGSGTGVVTRMLAELVQPGGRAVGVEPNPALRDLAIGRAAAAGSLATFTDGTAAELPVPDESVDLVWCERVLQHLVDPVAALREMHRILRAGGRALVLDTDHEARVNSAIDPDVDRRLQEVFLSRAANPSAARHIPQQAAEVGFVNDQDIGSAAVVFPRDMLVDSPLLRNSLAEAVAAGVVTEEEAARAEADQIAAAQAGTALVSVSVFAFVLHKRG
jgi:ubiquinone/menaquinone biosynthesis C-methylase UbiE